MRNTKSNYAHDGLSLRRQSGTQGLSVEWWNGVSRQILTVATVQQLAWVLLTRSCSPKPLRARPACGTGLQRGLQPTRRL